MLLDAYLQSIADHPSCPNSDGTRPQLKERGGTFVVQDHETAESPIMTAPALSATAADHVLPLSEIAPLLYRCAAQSWAAAR